MIFHVGSDGEEMLAVQEEASGANPGGQTRHPGCLVLLDWAPPQNRSALWKPHPAIELGEHN